MNQEQIILAELLVQRVPLTLKHDCGNCITQTTALNHICKDPAVKLIFEALGGGGQLGNNTSHLLYDPAQMAIVSCFANTEPTVVLAFRNSAQLRAHKTLSTVGEPYSSITAFAKHYCPGSPPQGNRLFLHLSINDRDLPNDGEEWGRTVLDALKITSSGDWNELGRSITAAEKLGYQSQTLAGLLPQAAERLTNLEPVHQQKRQCTAVTTTQHSMSTAPEAMVILAPPGGSLSQKQVDDLVAVGIRSGIEELAFLKPETSAGLCEALLAGGQAGRKKLLDTIASKWSKYKWLVNAGKDEAQAKWIMDKEIKEAKALWDEKVDKEIKEAKALRDAKEERQASWDRDDRNAMREAAPWVEHFTKPIPADEWTASLLYAWEQHGHGMALRLRTSIGALSKVCQLPRLVRLVAKYAKTHDYGNFAASGFIGTFEHPSGKTIDQLAFQPTTLYALDGGMDIFQATDQRALPLLSKPMVMPWMFENPEAARPTTEGTGPMAKFLVMCDATSRADANGEKYNDLVEESQYLKLASGSVVPLQLLRTAFRCFCTNNALDFEEEDLTPMRLSEFGIRTYIRQEDCRKVATGFAEVHKVFAHSATPKTFAQVTGVRVKLGIHRNGRVGVALFTHNEEAR